MFSVLATISAKLKFTLKFQKTTELWTRIIRTYESLRRCCNRLVAFLMRGNRSRGPYHEFPWQLGRGHSRVFEVERRKVDRNPLRRTRAATCGVHLLG